MEYIRRPLVSSQYLLNVTISKNVIWEKWVFKSFDVYCHYRALHFHVSLWTVSAGLYF